MKTETIIRRVFLCVLLCIGLCVASFTWVHAAERGETETIRVGFYRLDGYHEKTEEGMLTGYGYDFLQMISGYADFEYEYIGYEKTWNDMFQMLDDGQIDLLTSVQYTDERAERFDFSKYPIGYCEAILTTTAGNDQLESGEYDSYEGIRIGMMRGSSQDEKMFTFAEEHHFTFDPVYYDTQEELDEALQKQKVDAILTTSIRKLGSERVLERFDRAPYYVIVKKGNQELLDQVDDAIEKLSRDYPSWMNDLEERYYTDNHSYLMLEPDERAYLEQLRESGQELKVLINPDMKPYSYYEDGQVRGILVDYFNEICRMYDIKCTYLQAESSEEYLRAIYDKKADVVLTTNFLRWEADCCGYYLTRPIMDAPLCLISRNDANKDLSLENKTIAVVRGMSSIVQAIEAEFPNTKIVLYDSSEDSIRAVTEGKSDGALLYEYAALQYLNEDWKNELRMMDTVSTSITFAIVIPKEDHSCLYRVLNQGIEAITEKQLQNLILPYTMYTEEEPLWIHLYHRPVLFISAVTGLMILIVMCFLWFIRKMRKAQQEKQKRSEYEILHDPLTGVYNRQGYRKIVQMYKEDSRPFALIQIDIDNFKQINDNYGHAFGDEVLKETAVQLSQAFRTGDYVFRMGGDEFCVLLTNCGSDAWESISYNQRLIHIRLNQALKKDVTVTITMGISWSEAGIKEKMLYRADAALYQAKKRGRSGCCVVDEEENCIFAWRDDIGNSIGSNPLEQSDTGACRLELPLGKSEYGRLICNETARSIMGFTDQMTPEECFQTWLQRIDPYYKESIDKAGEAMLHKGQAECTYLYNHPVRGKIMVRSGGRCVSNQQGIVFYGYHQSLQHTCIILQEDDSWNLIAAMNRAYVASYYISLRDDWYCIFKSAQEAGHLEKQEKAASEVIRTYTEIFVKPCDRGKMEQFADLHTLAQRLQDKDFIESEYESTEEGRGWCRMSFFVIRRDETGQAERVQMLIASIDR